MVIDWMSVDSSVFEAVAYRGGERQLYLKFHGGRVWRYFDFPVHQYDEFLASESLGRYFGKHIRGQFREEEVQEERIPRRSRSAQNPANRSTANG
jgi:hypothetical protein